jgi:hypothetical protein
MHIDMNNIEKTLDEINKKEVAESSLFTLNQSITWKLTMIIYQLEELINLLKTTNK